MAFKPYCGGDVAAVKSPPFSRWKYYSGQGSMRGNVLSKNSAAVVELVHLHKKQIAHARAANGAHRPHIDNLKIRRYGLFDVPFCGTLLNNALMRLNACLMRS